jgi:hypothetical protein
MFNDQSYSAIARVADGQQIVEGLILEFQKSDGQLATTAFPIMYTLKRIHPESWWFHFTPKLYHALSAGIIHPMAVDYSRPEVEDFWRRDIK